jgi:hypothetical protein
MPDMPDEIKEHVRNYGESLETLGKKLAEWGGRLKEDPSNAEHHLFEIEKQRVEFHLWTERWFDSLRGHIDGSWRHAKPPER